MFKFFKFIHNKFFNFTTVIGTEAFSSPSTKIVDNNNGVNKPQEQNDEPAVSSSKDNSIVTKDTTETASKNNNIDETSTTASTTKDAASAQQDSTSNTVLATDKNMASNSEPLNSSETDTIEEVATSPSTSEEQSLDASTSNNAPRDYIASEEVVQECITLEQCTSADIDLMKDVIVAARTGYLDYSVLKRHGYVDSDGYVLDSDALYDSWLLQAGFWGGNGTGSYFSDEELAWGQENFEVIRVLEATNGWFQLPYEVNLSLLQDKDTGDYTISLAGTSVLSIGDWFTNLGNTFGVTTPHYKAESKLIDRLFEEDIEEGATVDIVGYSMGGTQAMLQYYRTPDLYDDVYAIQPQGLDGLAGTLYDDFLWDGMGDDNITAIMSDEKGFDFNDIVTNIGHIPAGTIYDVTVDDGNNDGFFDNFLESHYLEDVWDAVYYNV